MKKLALLIALSLICVNAEAATTAPAKTTATPAQSAQQSKMKTCARQYHQKGIAKSQYHAFMSQCLKAKPGATTTASTTKPPAPTTVVPATPAPPIANSATPADTSDMKP
jgi:hypothetical protein